MRIPQRRSQLLKRSDEPAVLHLTAQGIQKLKDELERLERYDHPQAVDDVHRFGEMGDRSENAEYQEAKFRLSRTDGRIFSIKDRLKRAVVIQSDASDKIQLGSTVVLHVNNQEKTYLIVGPQEANPTQGRISYVSPLGSELLGHGAGEEVTIKTANGETMYKILEVK